MKIVVTGNIGCGKSTAVKYLQELLPHYELFDFDKVVASLYEDEIIQVMLDALFGTHVKSEISDIVHADPEKMKHLADLLNSQLIMLTQNGFAHENVILDIPLYFEKIEPSVKQWMTKGLVVCIVADEDSQIERVKARNGWSEEKIRSVMAKQMSQQDKANNSNYVIHNFGSVDDLKLLVETFVHFLELI